MLADEMPMQKRVRLGATAAVGLVAMNVPTAAQRPPRDEQIAAAVLPAPEARRAGATVLGYDGSDALVTLRRGSNDLICLADNPTDDRFSAACYHEDLEPFMARGRELAAQGVSGLARVQQRDCDVVTGAIEMPREPRTLHVVEGAAYDPRPGTVTDSKPRWVIYSPDATSESTGLSGQPDESGPWLMLPGTASAHIMIGLPPSLPPIPGPLPPCR